MAVAGMSFDALIGEVRAGSDQRVAWSLDALPDLLGELGVGRVGVVVSPHAVGAVGGYMVLEDLLSGFGAMFFDDFTPNPKVEEALVCARVFAAHGAEAVVAVGGGSCLDVAKLAGLGVRQGDATQRVLRGEVKAGADGLPLIVAPPTTGTGSEATPFAAIYVEGKKRSIGHRSMRPRAAILDRRFAEVMPAGLAAETSLDALCQAMESLWAVGSDADSIEAARAALPLLADHIVDGVRGDGDARAMMQVGAYLAGRAIAISKTTASHAMSYALTTNHGLAHGLAVAMTVGSLAAFNSDVEAEDCLDMRGVGHVRSMAVEAASALGVEPADAHRRVMDIVEDCGLSSSLKAVGVDEGAIGVLAGSVDPVRLSNNPRRLTEEDAARMYRAALLS